MESYLDPLKFCYTKFLRIVELSQDSGVSPNFVDTF
jgi:hypothetical protein